MEAKERRKHEKFNFFASSFWTSEQRTSITSEFTFDVESSGPDIYVCNAGIKHLNPAGTVSDRQGNGTVTTDDQGDFLQDVMEYRYQNYSIWDLAHQGPLLEKIRVKADGSPSFTTVAGTESTMSHAPSFHKIDYDGQNELNKVVTFLKFELSSERFGTEYFVDVCYYGPRFHSGPVGTIFVAKAQVSFTNLFHNNYRSLSGLQVRGELLCDGQSKASTQWQSANVSAKNLWSQVNLGGYAKTKCVTRYSFKETASHVMRPNGKHGARVKVKTTITDPVL